MLTVHTQVTLASGEVRTSADLLLLHLVLQQPPAAHGHISRALNDATFTQAAQR